MDHEYKKLIAVVENNGFTAASEAMHISQPALSVAIKNLEQTLGAELIIRDGRTIRLSEAGKIAYEHALRLQTEERNMQRRISDAIEGNSQFIIGMVDTLAEEFYQSSDIDISAHESVVDSSSRLVEAVENGTIDIAFVVQQQAGYDASLQANEEGVEKFELVSAPILVAQAKAGLKHGKLDGIISTNRSSTTFAHFDRQFRECKIKPEYAFYSTDAHLIQQLMLQGRGVAILPEAVAQRRINDGSAKSLGLKFTRPIDVVVRQGVYINKPMEKVLADVRSLLT